MITEAEHLAQLYKKETEISYRNELITVLLGVAFMLFLLLCITVGLFIYNPELFNF